MIFIANQKNQFKNDEERRYYNAVFNRVYNSIVSTYYDKRISKNYGINKKQKQRLLNAANQYTLMLMRRHNLVMVPPMMDGQLFH